MTCAALPVFCTSPQSMPYTAASMHASSTGSLYQSFNPVNVTPVCQSSLAIAHNLGVDKQVHKPLTYFGFLLTYYPMRNPTQKQSCQQIPLSQTHPSSFSSRCNKASIVCTFQVLAQCLFYLTLKKHPLHRIPTVLARMHSHVNLASVLSSR
jgi:hypothetical protein